MKIEKIIDKTLKNGGITVNSELEEIQAKRGYVVSNYGSEKTYDTTDISDIKKLEKDIILYQKLLKNENENIGLWLDDDIIYLDVSRIYNNKKEAVRIAKANKQVAYYDIINDESINLIKYTYILYYYNYFKDDIEYITEYNYLDSLVDRLKVTKKTVQNCISESIDASFKIINNKYVVIREKLIS